MIGKSQRLFILQTAISAHETSRQSAILMSGLTHKHSFALAGFDPELSGIFLWVADRSRSANRNCKRGKARKFTYEVRPGQLFCANTIARIDDRCGRNTVNITMPAVTGKKVMIPASNPDYVDLFESGARGESRDIVPKGY